VKTIFGGLRVCGFADVESESVKCHVISILYYPGDLGYFLVQSPLSQNSVNEYPTDLSTLVILMFYSSEYCILFSN
jgi:hypothetical protein